jgi:cardiolipin synthase
MGGVLERAGVPVARFFPDFRSRVTAVNLRNHRKILVVDGRIGFTGGMNLRIHHLQNQRRLATRDLHFRVEGPIVGQFQEVFAQDWKFSTRESLRGERWFPRLSAVGSVLARAVPDGPDDDFDKLHWVLHAALHAARHRVRVMTPYFLPDRTLVNALNLAALRGVEVEILLPARNNLPFVHWAMVAQLWQVLDQGCRVWFTSPPFDHSKVMVVDDAWSLIGSANWDPRSLRLNFELDVECYDMDLAAQLNQRMDAALDGATPVTMATLNARSLPIRLRDGIARLFMPFL